MTDAIPNSARANEPAGDTSAAAAATPSTPTVPVTPTAPTAPTVPLSTDATDIFAPLGEPTTEAKAGAESTYPRAASGATAVGATSTYPTFPVASTPRRKRPLFGTIFWGVVLLTFAAFMVVRTLFPVGPDPILWLLGSVILIGLLLVVAGIAAASRRAD